MSNMDDYSDSSENDEEDDGDGLDPGQSWFFNLTEFPLVKTPPAMMEMDWITKLVEIVIGSERTGKEKAGKSAHQFGQNG